MVNVGVVFCDFHVALHPVVFRQGVCRHVDVEVGAVSHALCHSDHTLLAGQENKRLLWKGNSNSHNGLNPIPLY